MVLIFAIQACDHEIIDVQTVVHEDGSLDKTIILDQVDSSMINNNFFGINEANGWQVKVEPAKLKPKENDSLKTVRISKKKVKITFTKQFASSEAVNKELDQKDDTLFQVNSTFEKRFRWFYTYLYYADTYRPLDRLKHISKDDYFTQEDYAFIDRLSPEGSQILKADSLYMEQLGNKIVEIYFSRGVFEEEYALLMELLRVNAYPKSTIDSLARKKEDMYEFFAESKEGLDFDDDFALTIADKYNIVSLDSSTIADYQRKKNKLNDRIEFMYFFNNTRHFHHIQMPWEVVRTNADSLAGDKLVWKPSALKFMLKDYVMYAESRKMNLWAVIVSALLVIFTAYLIFKKR